MGATRPGDLGESLTKRRSSNLLGTTEAMGEKKTVSAQGANTNTFSPCNIGGVLGVVAKNSQFFFTACETRLKVLLRLV